MYERSLNQILHVLRRIKCLTYGMFLITCTTLVLYLLHDVMTIHITQKQAVFPITYRDESSHVGNYGDESSPPGPASVGGFSATIQVKYVHECQRQNNLIFTKTHKTGSSTISNILLRYGELHNLTQLLYKYPSSTEYNSLQENKLIQQRTTGNIFAQHASYNLDFLRQHIFNESRTFTILRHPVSQFISSFSFFDKKQHYPAGNFTGSIKRFLREHQKYLKQNWFCKNCRNLVNANAIDMGFSLEEFMHSTDRDSFVREFLARAHGNYDLVLITEYFDLSLVLLKRRFCLSFEDILYLKSLERVKKETVEDVDVKESIADIQRIDMAIYDYFNRTFWREVAKESRILEELAEFQRLNKQVQSFCIQGSKIGYKGTSENVLTPAGRDNFYCLAMNTRCLPFSLLLEARNDVQIKDEQLQEIASETKNQDSLTYHKLLYLDRNVDILRLASQDKS